jgi:threonine aldolase
MSAGPADFRSDTVTRPTPEMRQAMAAAEVGDDVLGEDPTVRALEEAGAALLGKPAALFLPSGTMANQVAVAVHCRSGDELICESRSHVFLFEGGGVARFAGTQIRSVEAADGFPAPEQVRALVRSDDAHHPHSRLLVLENSHNMAGGRVLAPDRMAALAAAARAHQLSVHVDGARLCNAAVAAACTPAALAAPADSVSLCLSKGLGAPIGSLLAGSVEFVRAARRTRKAFGGGMRQAGVLAAAGLIALRDWPELLVRDHARARRLAQGLAGIPGLHVDPATVETNIVMALMPADTIPGFLAFLRERSVLAATAGIGRVRFVTHRDLDDAAVGTCLQAVAAWAKSVPAKGAR